MADIYMINNIPIPCITQGRWLPRQAIDVQGDGRPLYSPVREFELRWNLQHYEDWEVLVILFNQLQSTGTYSVNIPAYPTATGTTFSFQEYSGTVLSEPQIGPFFNEQYPTDVAMIIGNIITP